MNISTFLDVNNTLINFPIGSGYAMSWIEAIAAITGLACVWLASKEKIINFFFGLISVTLCAIMFYQFQLYALLLLQVFFFVANLYGWFAWSNTSEAGDSLKIRWLSPQLLTLCGAISVAAIAFMTFYIDTVFGAFAQWTADFLNMFGAGIQDLALQPEAFPLLGSCVAVLSVVAQVLMTRKYVENWILWVGINVISIGIYTAQGLYVVAIQYVIFLFLAINGTREWIQATRKVDRRAIVARARA